MYMYMRSTRAPLPRYCAVRMVALPPHLLDHGDQPLEPLREPVPCARRARDDLPLPVANLHQIEHLRNLGGRQRVEKVLLVGVD